MGVVNTCLVILTKLDVEASEILIGHVKFEETFKTIWTLNNFINIQLIIKYYFLNIAPKFHLFPSFI